VRRWRNHAGAYAAYAAALTLLFAGVYGATNWISQQRSETYRVFTDWELTLPFVPQLVFVYFSVVVILFLPMFSVQRHEVRPLAGAFALTTGIAGLSFLLFPAQLGFVRPSLVPGYEPIFSTLYAIDLPYNTLPSLHVAYSTLALLTVARATDSRLARVGLALWLVVIAASVVLMHQHHIADVVAGFVLGFVCYRVFVYWAAKGAITVG
jgi:membrane-associated phospholipid phosphatase